MDLKVVADFIQAQGFPIFVAVWLLTQLFSMHAANLAVINDLIIEVRLLRAAIEHGALPAPKDA